MAETTIAEHSSELVGAFSFLVVLLITLVGFFYKLQNKRIDRLEDSWTKNAKEISLYLTKDELEQQCTKMRSACPKGTLIDTFGVELRVISANVVSIKDSIDKIILKQEILREVTLPALEKNISKDYVSIDRFEKGLLELKEFLKEMIRGVSDKS